MNERVGKCGYKPCNDRLNENNLILAKMLPGVSQDAVLDDTGCPEVHFATKPHYFNPISHRPLFMA
jgi:hypothetical protein